ncbi:ATP-dependent DNA helicase PIF1-like protein, partial [Tanacetum coccineum]
DEYIIARHSLNTDQKVTYDTIMRHVDADSLGMFFIDGPEGTGKTFLYKALLTTVRSYGLITLATASSRAGANNMTGATVRFHGLIALATASDGVEEVIDEDYVRILDDMTIPYIDEATSKDALINEIFLS